MDHKQILDLMQRDPVSADIIGKCTHLFNALPGQQTPEGITDGFKHLGVAVKHSANLKRRILECELLQLTIKNNQAKLIENLEKNARVNKQGFDRPMMPNQLLVESFCKNMLGSMHEYLTPSVEQLRAEQSAFNYWLSQYSKLFSQYVLAYNESHNIQPLQESVKNGRFQCVFCNYGFTWDGNGDPFICPACGAPTLKVQEFMQPKNLQEQLISELDGTICDLPKNDAHPLAAFCGVGNGEPHSLIFARCGFCGWSGYRDRVDEHYLTCPVCKGNLNQVFDPNPPNATFIDEPTGGHS